MSDDIWKLIEDGRLTKGETPPASKPFPKKTAIVGGIVVIVWYVFGRQIIKWAFKEAIRYWTL